MNFGTVLTAWYFSPFYSKWNTMAYVWPLAEWQTSMYKYLIYWCFVQWHARKQQCLNFSGLRATRSLVFCVVFCTSLFVFLSFFFWLLCFLSFFDLWVLITRLVFSNFVSCNRIILMVVLGFIPEKNIVKKQYGHFYVCMHHGPVWKHQFTKEWGL